MTLNLMDLSVISIVSPFCESQFDPGSSQFNVQSWIPLTLLSGVAHNLASRVSEAGIFLLLIRIVPIVSGAQQPVTVITSGKLRVPISPCVFDLLSSTL